MKALIVAGLFILILGLIIAQNHSIKTPTMGVLQCGGEMYHRLLVFVKQDNKYIYFQFLEDKTHTVFTAPKPQCRFVFANGN